MEKDFESSKKEYINRLRDNFELFERIKFNESKQGDALITKEIVLDPKNEEELLFAIFILDFADLSVRAATSDVKTILPEDNVYLNLLIDVMNSLKNSKDVKHMVEEAKNNTAKYLYDYIVGFIDDIDATIDYLAKETGYNLYDDFESAQFQLYLEKANGIINISETGAQKENISNEEFKIMCNEFHRLCEEGRLKNIERIKNKYGFF